MSSVCPSPIVNVLQHQQPLTATTIMSNITVWHSPPPILHLFRIPICKSPLSFSSNLHHHHHHHHQFLLTPSSLISYSPTSFPPIITPISSSSMSTSTSSSSSPPHCSYSVYNGFPYHHPTCSSDFTHTQTESDPEDDDDDADHHPHVSIPQCLHHHNLHHLSSPSTLPPDRRWDVLGLGQAMVDFSGAVDDEFLQRLRLEKGTRKVVNHEERGRVLQAMDGCSYKAAAGGSLSNTLVALARLGCVGGGAPSLNVAMAGSIGSDPLGGFYRSKLKRANVSFLSPPVKEGTTGTVVVLTTPDAQRTMLAYQGPSSTISYNSCLASAVCKTNVLVVEGYLFELPDTIKTISKACEVARSCGALVAVTASDVSCIERHYDDFWDIIANYADIVFANSNEARAFCDLSYKESPVSATRYLSHFVPLVSVTDGASGSYIGVKGEAVYIPPAACIPMDTCGAGDAYASGILYGITRGVSDLKGMGGFAAKVASVVVEQQGTRLGIQDAVELANSFTLCRESSSTVFRSDVGSDQISSL